MPKRRRHHASPAGNRLFCATILIIALLCITTVLVGKVWNPPSMAASSAPVQQQTDEPSTPAYPVVHWLSKIFFGVDFTNSMELIAAQIPGFFAVQSQPAWLTASAEELHPDDERNVSDQVRIEIERIQDDFTPIVPSGDGPQLLIYHTHTQEAFAKATGDNYVESEQWRTSDNNYNVVRLGTELASLLKDQYGIESTHDTANYEPPQHSTAYSRSLEGIRSYQQEHQYNLYIDLHRDAYFEKVGQDNYIVVNGKKIAQIMVVIGTAEGSGSVTYTEKPEWKENYKVALRLTNKLNELCPGIAKPVAVWAGRYNQHISTNAILIEVGNNINTLDEVMQSIPYLAQAVASLLQP